MGEKKADFMKAASRAVAECLGKPESFVVVAVLDEQSLIWGGEDTPYALCNVASLGSINKSSNTRLSGALTALMSEFGVTPDRMYTNFWDIGARENCGYNGVTFAEGAPAPRRGRARGGRGGGGRGGGGGGRGGGARTGASPSLNLNLSPSQRRRRRRREEEEEEEEEKPPSPEAGEEEEGDEDLGGGETQAHERREGSEAVAEEVPRAPGPLADRRERGGVGGLTFDDKDGPNGKRVINIELDDMDISGDLPSEIGGFDKLTVLALDGNQSPACPRRSAC